METKNARRGKEDAAVGFEGPVAAAGSDDARVSWSPRRRELPLGGGNTVRKLMRREIGGLSGRRPPRLDAAFCAEKFRRFKLQGEFLVEDDTQILQLLTRSITQIIPANDFIFVINWSGHCVAFRHTANASIAPYKKNGRIWYFNNYGEQMQTLFYNKINGSIITVSTSIARRGYRMRAIPLERIRRCEDWGHGTPVFGSWTNNFPSFDDSLSFAIISLDQSDGNSVSHIYEMNNYQLVHFIRGEIHSIATRPGIMIVAYKLIHNCLPIEVFSTENWTLLHEFSYSMPQRRTLKFLGLCYENILLQEIGQNMKIIDIWNNNNVTTIEKSKDQRLLSSCDLNGNDVLLIFEDEMVVVCNSRGVQVPLIEGSGNEPNCFTFQVHVTRDKKFAILYSRKTIEDLTQRIYNREASSIGTINIRNTFNGKSILKVNPWDDPEALQNVTALFYDEEHHTIYTGNTRGFIHVWSN